MRFLEHNNIPGAVLPSTTAGWSSSRFVIVTTARTYRTLLVAIMSTVEKKEAPPLKDQLRRAYKRALGGGIAGAAGM